MIHSDRTNAAVVVSLLQIFLLFACGCSSSQATDPHAIRLGKISTDLSELRKFCNLPADIQSCQWQTWSNMDDFGFGDWGLVAVVKLGEAELAERGEPSPAKHLLPYSGEPMPAWMSESTATMLKETDQRGVYSIQGETFEVGNVGKSPLLHGLIIQGPEKTWIIKLYTM